MEKVLYSIFAVNLDKINLTMIQVWYCQKKIIDLMQEDGFDAYTHVRVGVKSGGCLVCHMI
jgi:hypothetical protein